MIPERAGESPFAGRTEPGEQSHLGARCPITRRSPGRRTLHDVALSGTSEERLRVSSVAARCGHPHRKPTISAGVRGRSLSTPLADAGTPTACATGESRARRGARPGRRAARSWQLAFGSQSKLRSASTMAASPGPHRRRRPRFRIETIASETDRVGVPRQSLQRDIVSKSRRPMGLTSKNRTGPLLLSEWHAPKPPERVRRLGPMDRTGPGQQSHSAPGARMTPEKLRPVASTDDSRRDVR